MRTDHLFELWGLDSGRLSRAAAEQLGECDTFVGGSLADDLGALSSDIDLYCFVPPGHGRGLQAFAIGGVVVELHVVPPEDYHDYPHSLARLLSAPQLPSGPDLPLPTSGDLRVMHALWRDQGLRRGEYSESARARMGADVLHLYVVVRAVASAASLVLDAIKHRDSGDEWATLHCARLAAEASCDAVLASVGLYNPNPKWRISLLRRFWLNERARLNEARVLAALFPNPTPSAWLAAAHCIDTIRHLLEPVRANHVACLFSAVDELEKALDSWTDVWGADDARRG